MSDSIDGGPAFPVVALQSQYLSGEARDGMSLRDWFAGIAAAGHCANPELVNMTPDAVAKWSYDQADAMLAERVKIGASKPKA